MFSHCSVWQAAGHQLNRLSILRMYVCWGDGCVHTCRCQLGSCCSCPIYLGSGLRLMICVTLFCTLRKSELHAFRVQFSHVRVFSDSRNVQKRATRSDTSGHCLHLPAAALEPAQTAPVGMGPRYVIYVTHFCTMC